jgi:hypothetical protein
VPTASNQMTPNSHRRLQTTQRRCVTPTTPHHMTRRSAVPLNLSQDAKRDCTARHSRFSLPIVPSNTPVILQPSKNEHIIIMPEMANAVICPDTGKSLKNSELKKLLRYKIRWMRSTANGARHLAQGLKHGVKGTNTIKFIRREDVPAGRKATYGSFVVDIKAHKENTERTHLTVGGDPIEYPGDKSTRNAGITTTK